jgi:hypothetical protein
MTDAAETVAADAVDPEIVQQIRGRWVANDAFMDTVRYSVPYALVRDRVIATSRTSVWPSYFAVAV